MMMMRMSIRRGLSTPPRRGNPRRRDPTPIWSAVVDAESRFPEEKDDDAKKRRRAAQLRRWHDFGKAIDEVWAIANQKGSKEEVRLAVTMLERKNMFRRPSQYTKALSALAKVGDSTGAAALVRRMPEHSTIAYNTALRACARSRDSQEAAQLVIEMQTPDALSFGTAIASQSRYNAHVVKTYLEKAHDAERLRTDDDKTNRLRLAYREAVLLCARHGQYHDAMGFVLTDMVRHGIERHARDYKLVGEACFVAEKFDELLIVLKLAIRDDVDSDDLHAYYIEALARDPASSWEKKLLPKKNDDPRAVAAVAALRRLRQRRRDQRLSLTPGTTPLRGPPTAVASNAALKACGIRRAGPLAVEVLKEVEEEKVAALQSGVVPDAARLAPDATSYLWALRANRGDVDACLELLARARKGGLTVNSAMCAAAMEAFADKGDATLAFDLLSEMDLRGVRVDPTAAAAAVRCLLKANEPRKALDFYRTERPRWTGKSLVGTHEGRALLALDIAGLDACTALELFDDATDIFQGSRDPWVVAAYARSLASAGRWRDAIDLYMTTASDDDKVDEEESSRRRRLERKVAAARAATCDAAINACWQALETTEDRTIVNAACDLFEHGAQAGLYARPFLGKRRKVMTLDLHGAPIPRAKTALLATFKTYDTLDFPPTLCVLTGAKKLRASLRPGLETFLSQLRIKFDTAPNNAGILVIAGNSVTAFNHRDDFLTSLSGASEQPNDGSAPPPQGDDSVELDLADFLQAHGLGHQTSNDDAAQDSSASSVEEARNDEEGTDDDVLDDDHLFEVLGPDGEKRKLTFNDIVALCTDDNDTDDDDAANEDSL